MAQTESPPWGRGETFYAGATIDPNNLGGLQHEGKLWEFDDLIFINPGQVGAKPTRTNRRVLCMAVRNVSGQALLPGRLAHLTVAGATPMINAGRIDGYAYVTGALAMPIDEFLPAAGVPNNDLCWVVVSGPATCITGASGNTIAVGGLVDCLAGTGLLTADAGLVEAINAAATNSYPYIHLGRSLGVTSGAGQNVLVDIWNAGW